METYGDFKDLPRRTAAGRVIPGNSFNIAKNPRYNDINANLFHWFNFYFMKNLLLREKLCQTKNYQKNDKN